MMQVWAIWPNGKIPYTLTAEGFSDADRAFIASAFDYLEEETSLRFEPAPDLNGLPRLDIKSASLNGFCYANWANPDGNPWNTWAEVLLTPESGCTLPRTIIHEIMHALSMYHTHTRFDRDRYIKVLWDNVQPDKVAEFNECSGCCCDTWGFEYDCDSVMHYAKDQMSKNGLDTLEAIDKANCNLLPYSKWNLKFPYLSKADINWINAQYPLRTP